MSNHRFSRAELKKGHKLYLRNEPRQAAYAWARGRVEAAIVAKDVQALTGAVWPFLLEWNKTNYRFRPELVESHPLAIHDLLLWYWHYQTWIDDFRGMTI